MGGGEVSGVWTPDLAPRCPGPSPRHQDPAHPPPPTRDWGGTGVGIGHLGPAHLLLQELARWGGQGSSDMLLGVRGGSLDTGVQWGV